MKIAIDGFKLKDSGGSVRGTFTLHYGDIQVYGCMLMHGKYGFFVGFPKRVVDKKYFDLVRITNDETKKAILDLVMVAYKGETLEPKNESAPAKNAKEAVKMAKEVFGVAEEKEDELPF